MKQMMIPLLRIHSYNTSFNFVIPLSQANNHKWESIILTICAKRN